MKPIESRLLNQQLSSPKFTRPEDVVSWLGAIQAQDYRMMRWAVAMRTNKPSAEAFRDAFDDGRIIRQHLMRGTWQLVSGKDFHWMQELFRTKALSVIKGWMHSNGIDIPEDEEQRIRDILIQTTSMLRSATKEDYNTALLDKGIVMDDHRLSYHIRFSELKGFLCSGDLTANKASYSLVEEKIPVKGAVDRDEALSIIARKYFQSRQPASLEDFVWWSGLGIADCRKGITLLGDWLHRVTIGGREFYISDDSRTRGMKIGEYILLPPYDEYLIGYKSRDLALSPEYAPRAHNTSGNFYPVIAFDGIICGNWQPFRKDTEPDFFPPWQDHSLPDEVTEKYMQFRKEMK